MQYRHRLGRVGLLLWKDESQLQQFARSAITSDDESLNIGFASPECLRHTWVVRPDALCAAWP